MLPYRLNIPTRIYFGRDILEKSLEAEAGLLSRNVLVVTTGRSLVRLGHLDALRKALESVCPSGSISVFDGISANPLVSEVDEAVACGRRNKASVVIGFGGGSAIDAAKAVAAGIGTGVPCRELFDNDAEPGLGTLPVLAIPTTAGTGSELSRAAILSDDRRKIKKGLRGNRLYPAAAIVDSLFTETVPFRTTMETGFDVLAHAMETYFSKQASPYTRMLSEQAVRIVGKNLPLLASGLNNSSARQEMSYASMIMGINLGNASTCLPHRMQYPLGAHTGTSHGAGLAALYPAWLHYELVVSLPGLTHLLDLLGCPARSGCDGIVPAFTSFLQSLGLPVSLRELGVKMDLLDVFAEEVSGNIQNDPVATGKDIIREIYHKAF